jgi:hypothetical protein
MNRALFAILIFSFGAAVVLAADAAGEPQSLSTETVLKVTARVESVDLDTRVVSLRTPEGMLLTFTAAESIRKLERVDIGDTVDYEFVSHVTLLLIEENGAVPDDEEHYSESTESAGEKPSITKEASSVRSAKIVAIDRDANTFKLEWPDGSIDEHTAKEKKNLDKASVGDYIVITQTEKMVISVKKPAPE